MKGVQIERALPSNILDVYALFQETVKEGSWNEQTPNPKQAKEYYFQLIKDLMNPHELIYLARKGRAYFGYIHCQLGLRPWNEGYLCFIKMIHVTKNKRKLGIGKLLTDRVIEDCKKLGITKIELMANDSLVDYWVKKRKARKIMNLLVMEG